MGSILGYYYLNKLPLKNSNVRRGGSLRTVASTDLWSMALQL